MDTKPFWQTSEFYVMLCTQIVSILSMTGKLTPEQADTVTKNVPVIAGALMSIVSAFSYVQNRTQIKIARAQLIASTQSAQPPSTVSPMKMSGL